MRGRRAFTLIEILVTLGIVLALAALLLPAVKGMQRKGGAAVAASQMRQIGLAVINYASDQGGRLPVGREPGQEPNLPVGMAAGQGPNYDPARPEQLATALGPYLGVSDLQKPSLVKVFVPPALARAMRPTKPQDTHPFVMNLSAEAKDERIFPWGDAKTGAPSMMIHAVPPSVWMFCDADQQNPAVKGQPWAGRTPKSMVHGKQRLALYFDGSVQPIDESLLKAPPGGGPPPPPPPGGPGGPPPPKPPPPPP